MHPSSLENMGRLIRRYVNESFLDGRECVTVLDVGGANVNGSYRDLLVGEGYQYLAADLVAGEGIDLVLEDPYRIPAKGGTYDLVISGQMLEHCECFWLTFAEMMRVVKDDGCVFLIAPSAGRIHRYPVDCYRFYPDAYAALAKYAQCELVECWLDDRGPWRDLVGVFRPRSSRLEPSARRRGGSSIQPPHVRVTAAPANSCLPPATSGSDEEERTVGLEPYSDTLTRIHSALKPDLYVEIGVNTGVSLRLAQRRAIGVDPAPSLQHELPNAEIHRQTSDDFFAETAESTITAPVELAFIDGLHLFEYAFRDFLNLERRAGPAGVIVVDDIFPNHAAQANRFRRTHHWTGDVWRLHTCLKHRRPDLLLIPLDTHPTGLLLIAGLDPAHQMLWDYYNDIVSHTLENVSDPPADVLSREGAVDPNDPRIQELLEGLRELRQRNASMAEVLRFTQVFRQPFSPRSCAAGLVPAAVEAPSPVASFHVPASPKRPFFKRLADHWARRTK